MMTLTVVPDSGDKFDVEIKSRDILAWERSASGAKSFNQLQEDLQLGDLYTLTYAAASRQGLVPGVNSLAEFEQGFDLDFTSLAKDEDSPKGSDQEA